MHPAAAGCHNTKHATAARAAATCPLACCRPRCQSAVAAWSGPCLRLDAGPHPPVSVGCRRLPGVCSPASCPRPGDPVSGRAPQVPRTGAERSSAAACADHVPSAEDPALPRRPTRVTPQPDPPLEPARRLLADPTPALHRTCSESRRGPPRQKQPHTARTRSPRGSHRPRNVTQNDDGKSFIRTRPQAKEPPCPCPRPPPRPWE